MFIIFGEANAPNAPPWPHAWTVTTRFNGKK